jgi:transposase
MRGTETKQSSMLCLMSPEARVPTTHPLRAIKKLADKALEDLSPVFDAMYSSEGRPSIPPERLLKSMLLMALYTVRSERLFCEQLDYNLLFRWFLDMDMVEQSFVPTVFTKNRNTATD